MDPVYATNAFYDALIEIDGYQDMEITVAAQEVQRSAFPRRTRSTSRWPGCSPPR